MSQELARLIYRLLDALERQDTLRDGNWGHLSFHAEVREMKAQVTEIIEKESH